MKGRLSLLGVLLVALFAVILMKSDRAQEIPAGIDRTEVPRMDAPSEPREIRREEPKTSKSRSAQDVVETQVPSEAQDEVTAPARMQIEVPSETAPPMTTPVETAPQTKESREGVDDRLPYPWIDPVQESQPGFVEPNRLDARNPSGDPILQRPAPTGPGAGFYDPDNRFAEPD